MVRIVVDTNVLMSAMLGATGASRAVLRLCLTGGCRPIIGEKLFHEYAEVSGRPALDRSPLERQERQDLVEAFLAVCEWTPVTFLWRPNLPDEGDNHIVELGVAGMAESIVTSNVRDFTPGELRFGALRVETPAGFLKRWRNNHGDDDHPHP